MAGELKGIGPGNLASYQLKAAQQESMPQVKTTKMDTSKAAEDKKIEQAAGQFEGMLLQQMFQAMWQTAPSSGMLSGSHEEELFRDMFNQSLAEEVSKGQGIGIKEIVAKELRKKG